MKIVLQKVTQARVDVDGKTIGEIADGFVLFVGVTHTDTEADIDTLVGKIIKLRLFSDPGSESFMERNIIDEGAGILVVPQFTLYGDCTKGTRPSFTDAARPEHAKPLFHAFYDRLRALDIRVEAGEFGAHMEVFLINDGPITLILES